MIANYGLGEISNGLRKNEPIRLEKNIKKCGVRFTSEIRYFFRIIQCIQVGRCCHHWSVVFCATYRSRSLTVLSTRKLSDDLQAPPSNALCSPLAPPVCLAGRSCKRTCVTIGVRCRWRLMIRCKGNGRYSYSQWKPTTMFM